MAKEETKRRNTKILQFWCVPINRAKVRENVAGELKKKERGIPGPTLFGSKSRVQ